MVFCIFPWSLFFSPCLLCNLHPLKNTLGQGGDLLFLGFHNSAPHCNPLQPVPQKSDGIWPHQVRERLQGQTCELLRRDRLGIPDNGDLGP